MRIEKTVVGRLHLILNEGVQSLKVENVDGEPMFQMVVSMDSETKTEPDYDVTRYGRARISLVVETEESPDYMQLL